MFNKFNNRNDDEDSKRIQDVQNRNQTRNISPSFSYGEQDNNVEPNNEQLDNNQDEKEQNVENKTVSTGGVVRKNTTGKLSSLIGGGALSKGSQSLLSSFIMKKWKMKLIIILVPTFVVIFLVIMLVILLASSQGDRNLSKNLLNIFSPFNRGGISVGSTSFPAIKENESFETYFKDNVDEYLINYLSINGYCSSDKSDCRTSDAYTFFKRYLEVIIAFERGNSEGTYYIDSGLIYETIGYNRSDEEMFLGSTKKIEDGSFWFGWLKNLFDTKTDEISKLANKMWREVYSAGEDSNDTYWKFSLDKYVAYLMYGDTMNDISNPKVGTNKDLNIKASKTNINNKGTVTSNTHTYKYGNCQITDKDYEGDVTSGYIYMRFKDEPILNVSKEGLEQKISEIIQAIFDKAVEVYGEPNYCKNGGGYGSGMCSAISLHSTSFTKEQFVSLVEDYAKNYKSSTTRNVEGIKALAAHADEIYDMGISNNVNPEMVFIRASSEGYSPGVVKNNFWGMGCYNECPDCCLSYPSVMKGVEDFIKNISNYDSVEAMMQRYAYIGKAWYKGSWATGGCKYFSLIESYYENTPEAQASKSNAKAACDKGGDESVKTTEHDQLAYSKWQVANMAEQHRTKIFKKGADICNDGDFSSILNANSELGEKVALYAVSKFDSWGYSQDDRWKNGFVDCSSLVYRTYTEVTKNETIKVDFGGASTADGEYRWCIANNKLFTDESKLKPGDLIFPKPQANGKVGHVEIYIGNNQRFGAHGRCKNDDCTILIPLKDQVSILPYVRGGSFKYYCRPY